jgi:hypothetical protein
MYLMKKLVVYAAILLLVLATVSCDREAKGLKEEIKLLKEENSFLKAENASLKRELEQLYKGLEEKTGKETRDLSPQKGGKPGEEKPAKVENPKVKR